MSGLLPLTPRISSLLELEDESGCKSTLSQGDDLLISLDHECKWELGPPFAIDSPAQKCHSGFPAWFLIEITVFNFTLKEQK